MAKWMLAKKVWARLWHGVVCSNVTGGTKQRIAQSKRARGGSLAVVDQPQPSGQMSCCLSLALRLFVFASFSYIGFYQTRGLQSVLDIRRYFQHDHFITIVISGVYFIHGDLPRQHPFRTFLRFTGFVPSDSQQ